MVALVVILIALVVLDIVAHLQHISVMEELKNDVRWMSSKLDQRGKTP